MTLSHLFAGPFGGCLEWLLRASLSGAFIAAAILLIQLLFGRWLTPAWRYRLWAVMVIRLVLPVLPASPASLSNFEFSSHVGQILSLLQSDDPRTQAISDPAPDVSIQPDSPSPKTTIVYGPAPHVLAPLPQSQAKVASVNTHESFQHLPAILFGAWLAGVFMFSVRLIGANVLLSGGFATQ